MKATTKITTETVMQPIEVKTKTIILELTVEEALWLQALTTMVGGCPHKTPRGIFDNIGNGLNRELPDTIDFKTKNQCFSTSVYFNQSFDYTALKTRYEL